MWEKVLNGSWVNLDNAEWLNVEVSADPNVWNVVVLMTSNCKHVLFAGTHVACDTYLQQLGHDLAGESWFGKKTREAQ